MTDETTARKVKLICGMISTDVSWFDMAESKLVAEFGPVDISWPVMDFDFTDYYDSQTGSPLLRKFLAFEKLIFPDRLAGVKRKTNELETELASRPDAPVPRPVNIDPGYLAPSRLILASMKDFSHRICLDGGVYAEVTLLYNRGWQVLPWTFPDYGSGRYFEFLDSARELLIKTL